MTPLTSSTALYPPATLSSAALLRVVAVSLCALVFLAGCGKSSSSSSTPTYGDNWSLAAGLGTGTTPITALAYNSASGGYIAIANGAAPIVYTSSDGRSWSTAAQTGLSGVINDVAFAGNLFVAVGNAGAAFKSTDGVTWTAITPVTATPNLNAIAAGPQISGSTTAWRFVIVGNNHGIYYANYDGTTLGAWTAATAPTTTPAIGNLYGVTYAADAGLYGMWYAVGAQGAIISSSDDPVNGGGINWFAEPGLPSTTEPDLKSVAASSTLAVAIAANGKIFSKTNAAQDWVSTSIYDLTRATVALNRVAVDSTGAIFLAIGNNGQAYTSTTGTSWTQQKTGSTGYNLNDAVFANGQFVAVGGNGATAVGLYSTN